MSSTARRLLESFHLHLNAGDAAAVGALATDDVEIGGPRGTTSGRAILEDWVRHAHVRLHPRQIFLRDCIAIVDQEAEWYEHADGLVIGRGRVATVFRIKRGRLAAVIRHDDGLDRALLATGLTSADALEPESSG